MFSDLKSLRNSPIQVGDKIVEKHKTRTHRRIGEVLFIRSGKIPKAEILELNKHDLSPLKTTDIQKNKTFNLPLSECKHLNMFRYGEKKRFKVGDVIQRNTLAKIRFGTIVGFIHPEGLYSESYEKGHNGKDLLECVEISGRAGLPRKLDPDGNPKVFLAEPDKCKHCEILPMDHNGGVRIKNYWEIKNS
jgi:hypothetical protein